VKGIAAPVQASRVLRPSVVASRFEALRGSALSRLVGRDEEIDLLLRRCGSWAKGIGRDRVLIRRVEPEAKTAGGIFIPDTAQQSRNRG
jgi:hypothetical protein